MRFCEFDEKTIESFLPERFEDSHKGTYGSVFNIAGCMNYSGAAFLSSYSAFKVGCGLVCLASEKNVTTPTAHLAPEVIFLPLVCFDFPFSDILNMKKIISEISKYDVVSLGCGLGQRKNVKNFFKEFIKKVSDCSKCFVFDADALNIISKEKILSLPQNTIITPHPKELSRMIGKSVEQIQKERIQSAIEASEKFKCITVLKGKNTVVTDGTVVYENKTGNSALAKAGSGDVLCGMISGFLAQNILQKKQETKQTLFQTAVLSVYMHGKIAEVLSKEKNERTLTASELIFNMFRAFQ